MTVFEYAQSIDDTFGAISGGEFEYFPCQGKISQFVQINQGCERVNGLTQQI
jgi:hypothetical protein